MDVLFVSLRRHYCDLHNNDMSRKKCDVFRCTVAALCEIRRLLRSSI